MKHEGVQIWEVVDGQDVSYKSDPIEDVIFACGTIREVQALISICSLFGCVKSPAGARKHGRVARTRPASSR